MNLDVEMGKLRAAASEHAQKDSALEAKACALAKQYGLFMPGPVKELLRELADHLNWNTLKGIMK